tara:strand:- start:618 stop:908 length:291 start_codon:yes stop_codon:yes gene_type:complete
VKYGTPSGGTAYDVDTRASTGIQIDVPTYPLGVAEGDGGRLPAEYANGGVRSTFCHRTSEHFIDGHIEKGVSELRVQETPSARRLPFAHVRKLPAS